MATLENSDYVLEDGDAYEGGNLEFDLRNREDSKSVFYQQNKQEKKDLL